MPRVYDLINAYVMSVYTHTNVHMMSVKKEKRNKEKKQKITRKSTYYLSTYINISRVLGAN